MKPGLTWNDLVLAILKMPADQQNKPAFIAIDDEAAFRKIIGLEYIDDDVYVNKDDDEDCAPLKELKELHGDEFVESDYVLSTPKGTPYLIDDSHFIE